MRKLIALFVIVFSAFTTCLSAQEVTTTYSPWHKEIVNFFLFSPDALLAIITLVVIARFLVTHRHSKK